MSETKTALYLVKGNNIRHKGKTVMIGKTINLDPEEAERLKEFLEPVNPEHDVTGAALSGMETALHQASSRISELEAYLRAQQEAMATLIKEHDATVVDLNNQITELKKPVEKGSKK